VKTIGSVSKPSAIICAPLVIIKVPFDSPSPIITVPGSMVRTALLVTYTLPWIMYTSFFTSLVFWVIQINIKWG